jgi:hypothetical protein
MTYQSRLRLLGLPLVDIASGGRRVARGWIAIGDVAFGVVLSIGGVAAGGAALGGLALGVLPVGGLAVGLFALGGGAIGLDACGGAAIGWHAAFGGLAVARDWALGGAAVAREANSPAAELFFAQHGFFRAGRFVLEHSRWFVLLALLPALQAALERWRRARAARG